MSQVVFLPAFILEIIWIPYRPQFLFLKTLLLLDSGIFIIFPFSRNPQTIFADTPPSWQYIFIAFQIRKWVEDEYYKIPLTCILFLLLPLLFLSRNNISSLSRPHLEHNDYLIVPGNCIQYSEQRDAKQLQGAIVCTFHLNMREMPLCALLALHFPQQFAPRDGLDRP